MAGQNQTKQTNKQENLNTHLTTVTICDQCFWEKELSFVQGANKEN